MVGDATDKCLLYNCLHIACLLFYFAAPFDPVFEEFRKKFHAIDRQNLRLWTWPEMSQPHTFLVARALEVRDFLNEHLARGCFGRDDYRELAELIMKFLGGQVCIQ